eukprot:6040279-Pleurochrysis_carterae.AAC.1
MSLRTKRPQGRRNSTLERTPVDSCGREGGSSLARRRQRRSPDRAQQQQRGGWAVCFTACPPVYRKTDHTTLRMERSASLQSSESTRLTRLSELRVIGHVTRLVENTWEES